MSRNNQTETNIPDGQWSPSTDQLAKWVADYERDGFLILRNILSPDEVRQLRQDLIEAFDRQDNAGSDSDIIRHQMFLNGKIFEDLIDRAPAIDFLEAVLGPDCHVISMNAIYTRPGQGISTWHVDEAIHFPRPLGVPLDPRIPTPSFVVQLMHYLVDVDEELGPTQFVTGSHRSGRSPDPDLTYEDQGVHSIIVNAGDICFQNGQTWHRGAPNQTNDRCRCVQQVSYARRFISQRFYPFVNYHMPEDLLARSSPRRQRLLGVHPRGPYG